MNTDMEIVAENVIESLRSTPGFTDEMAFGIRWWVAGWICAPEGTA